MPGTSSPSAAETSNGTVTMEMTTKTGQDSSGQVNPVNNKRREMSQTRLIARITVGLTANRKVNRAANEEANSLQ